jgi:cytochrome c oxidase cbb3-type subunit 3
MRPDEPGADKTHSQSFHLRTLTSRIILVSRMRLFSVAVVLLVTLLSGAGLQAQGRGQSSPASVRPPQPGSVQTYPREQIDAGRTRFAAQCGFCHGRDAAGGETGTDLTRSALVAQDVRGDRLIPMIRTGRADKGMPAFTLSDTDFTAIVAFIHDQYAQAVSATGGRRAVDISDLQTGDAAAGQRYFDAACTKCHSASGDLRGLATRVQGLPLLQRMLYPGAGRTPGGPPLKPPTVTVTPKTGPPVTGSLAYRDEFTIALTDSAGWRRAWPTSQVAFTIDNPLQAHIDRLAKYSDKDMHDVLAYLHTLK